MENPEPLLPRQSSAVRLTAVPCLAPIPFLYAHSSQEAQAFPSVPRPTSSFTCLCASVSRHMDCLLNLSFPSPGPVSTLSVFSCPVPPLMKGKY